MISNEEPRREIALLLDWENIRFGLQHRNLTPNISAIMEEAQSLGRVVVARAYADFQNYVMFNDPRRLYAAGIEPVYVPGRVYQSDQPGASVRKNSVDVKLTADCVEFCHRYPNIDAYMLVSGDGDFIHLVNTLRPYGKFVGIIALSWTASPRLTESADLVRYYDLDVEPSIQRSIAPTEREDDAPAADAPATDDAPVSAELEEVYETMRDIVEDNKTPIVLAALKPKISQRIRGFSEVQFGHTKFKPLVMDAYDRGYVRVVTEGLVDWVMPVNSDFGSIEEDDPAPIEFPDSGAPVNGPMFRSEPPVAPPPPPPSDPAGFTRTAGPGVLYGEEEAQDLLAQLPNTLRRDIIRFCDNLEQRSRYITFRYLTQNLSQQPWIQLDYDQLVRVMNDAIEGNIFTRETFEDFDEYTGFIRRLPTLKLNREHPDVKEGLEGTRIARLSSSSFPRKREPALRVAARQSIPDARSLSAAQLRRVEPLIPGAVRGATRSASSSPARHVSPQPPTHSPTASPRRGACPRAIPCPAPARL